MDDIREIYLTSEQAHRLAGIACDALVGLQIGSTLNSDTDLYGSYVGFDEAVHSFHIEADGTLYDHT